MNAYDAGEALRLCGFVAAYYFLAASVVGPWLALMVAAICILTVRRER